MNKFWGRNEEGSIPKFTRDDDQILALNYENLCDADYLSRLFVSDDFHGNQDADFISESNDPQVNNQVGSSLFSSELSEDLMLFGDSPEMSKICFERRFYKEISSAGKTHDSISSVVKKQVTVFEHIGHLMLNRCMHSGAESARGMHILPMSVSKMGDSRSGDSNSQSGSIHVVSNSLSCALSILLQKISVPKTGKAQFTLKKSTLDGLLSILFQICEESSNSALHGSISNLKHERSDFNSGLLGNLRNIFTSCIFSCLNCSTNVYASGQLVEDNLKLAFSCFYGLLLIGFQSRNSSDLILATYYLLCILLQAEEWQEVFGRECKLVATMASSNGPPLNINSPRTIVAGNTPVTSTSSVSRHVPLSRGSTPLSTDRSGNHGGGGAKLYMKTKHNESNQHKVVNGNNSGGANNNALNSKLPNKPALPNVNNNGNKYNISSQGPKTGSSSLTRPVEELRSECEVSALNKIDLIPSLSVSEAQGKPQSNNNKTSWEKSNSKSAVLDKDFSKNKIQVGKSFKTPDVDLAAGNHSVIVNHVAVNYNVQSQSRVSSGTSSKNTNNNQANELHPQQQPGVSKSSNKHSIPIKPSTANNQQNTAAPNKTNRDPADKVRQEIREFNDMLQSNLKIPKSLLKIIHDNCMAISSSISPLKESASFASRSAGGTLLNPAATVAGGTAGSKPMANATKKTLFDNLGSRESSYTWKSSVWSCGQNSYGELGLGDVNLRKTFTKVPLLDDKCVVSIGAGNEHSLFVTKDGKLFTSGYNDNGQCGVGSTQQVRQPTLVQSLEGEEIAQVNVYNGCEHTLVITRDGKIFSFGYNYRGQLGLSSTNSESIPRPIRGLLSRKVVLAACSYHHSFMLCSDGSLFSCGRNDCGQLGHGDTIDKKIPQSVMNCSRNISSISCGQFHTVAATTAGVVYVCGKNDYGQLSLESANNVKTFTKAPFSSEIENIVQVCCGYYHTLVLSSTGIIAGFGRNDYGQLGLGHSQPKVYQSTVINSLRDKGVTMISAGCYHSVVVTANGMLYVFGRNNHGQLATGDLEERHSPHPVDDFIGQRILSVAAGFYHTLILSVDSSSSGSHGWEDGFLPPFVPIKGQSFYGPSGGITSHSLLEDVSHSHNDLRGVLLHATTMSGKESTVTALNNLIKDAALFAGVATSLGSQQLQTKGKTNAKSTFESRSKISTRELLVFLTNHIETLVAFDSQMHEPITPTSAETESLSANRTDYDKEIFRDGLESIQNLVSCVITMLEISRRTIEDCSQSNSKLPISQDDALNFFQRMIRILSTLLKKHKKTITQCMDILLALSPTVAESVFDSCSLSDLSLHTLLEIEETKSAELKSVSHLLKNSIIVHNETSDGVERGEENNCKTFYKTICKLRSTLLSAYLSMRVDEDRRTKCYEVLADVGSVITKFRKVLFPKPELLACFIEALQKNALFGTKGSNLTKPIAAETMRSFNTLNLRLIALSLNVFRNNDEVVKFFQQSQYQGLVLFRCMLSLYSQFSKQTLEKKIQQSGLSAISASAASSVGAVAVVVNISGGSIVIPAPVADIRRLMSLLEHCITNFIKCATPIIFASSVLVSQKHVPHGILSPSSTLDTSNLNMEMGNANSSLKVYHYGVDILREVLSDAEAVIDILLLPQQPLTEDIMNQLRYGTVMPSILPSILIYGLSFTKYGCIMTDIIPNLRSLIRKLQLVGKSDSAVVVGGNGNTPYKGNDKTKLVGTTKDDEIASDAQFEDNISGGGKKDSQQVSWWYRLLKLSVNFAASMATGLVSFPTKRFQELQHETRNFYVGQKEERLNYSSNKMDVNFHHHRIWSYLSLHASSAMLDISVIEARISHSTHEESTISDEVVQLCSVHRENEKRSDPMYRMLAQSTQALFSNNIFHEIEESIVEVLFFACGHSGSKSNQYSYGSSLKLLVRMIKHIHSHRSVLVSNSNGLSWVEILLRISNIVKIFCKLLLQGYIKYSFPAQLIVPKRSVFKNERLYGALRRAMLVIVCVSRWRSCVRNKLKDVANSLVEFVSSACNAVTNDYTTVDIRHCSEAVATIFESFVSTNYSTYRYSCGIQTISILLEDITSVNMKCDVVSLLIPALTIASRNVANKHYKTTPVCCEEDTFQLMRHADENIIIQFVKSMESFASGAALLSQNELQLIANSVRLLQIAEERRLHLYCASSFPTLPISTVRNLMILLNERQKRAINACDDKSAKKISNLRERNVSFYRASNALVSFIQSAAILECSDNIIARPNICIQLYETFTALVSHFQLYRLEVLRDDSNIEDINNSKSLNGTDVTSASGKNKEGSKKRCQDLINKPMEFCKNIEGFVVQGDKLINNYKGVDFSIATWIIIAKKTTASGAKQSFIAGKLSHNDAWPLIVLRPDNKLDIFYGHNNEFEKITSDSVLPHFTWTHISVVVEQKKIKLFINSALDSQMNTVKGNSRAVTFPLIVGCCPQDFRTRVSCVKEGFDGLLAQFKYYSRALSPIHIKVIFDNGPPETADNSERLVYRMLASMKWLTTQFNRYSDICSRFPDCIMEAANTMHMVFMTDTGRRTRFAALNVLSHIITVGAITDLKLCSRPHPINFSLSSHSLLESSLFSYGEGIHSLRHRFVLYLLRLAGTAFAPHLMQNSVSLDSGSPSSQSEFLDTIGGFLNIVPAVLSQKDGAVSSQDNLASNNQSNSSSTHIPDENSSNLYSTSVEKLASKEGLRIEACHHILRILRCFAESSEWNQVISTVLCSVFDEYSKPSRDKFMEMNATLKVDVLGATLLLGGGTAGKFLGSEVQNFFGNSRSIVLNINNTTNFVTLLSWNMSGEAQQITRVRLGDINAISRTVDLENEYKYNDSLSLSSLKNRKLLESLFPRIVHFIAELSQFAPLLLTDYLSVLQPDHPYQSKTVLRCLRPLELLVFSQLIKTVSNIEPKVLAEIGAIQIFREQKLFTSIIQQAATSTLCIPVSSGASNSTSFASGTQNGVNSSTNYGASIGVVAMDEVESSELHNLWTKSSRYVLSLPPKLGNFNHLNTSDNEKLLFDFVSQYFGIAVESLLNTPFEWLLRRGRLSELIHCLAVGSPSFAGAKIAGTDTHPTGIDEKFLMSDWSFNSDPFNATNLLTTSGSGHIGVTRSNSNSFYTYLTSSDYGSYGLLNTADNEQHQQDVINALQLLFHLRESIIRHSRQLLQLNYFLCDESNLCDTETSWNIVLWETTLPMSVSLNTNNALPHLLGFYDEMRKGTILKKDSSSDAECTWLRISNIFRGSNRIEVTQTISSTLRYSALSLLQTNSLRTIDNILESADLFKKIVQSMFYWIDCNKGQPREEEIYYHILKIILPSLSFIDSMVIELQLMQICMYTIRKLVLCLYDGYTPSKELLDLAKSNNFTLLRARAQEQVIKFKCHCMGSVSALAYNLTHIVTGLEIIQRFGCAVDSAKLLLAAKQNTISVASLQAAALSASSTNIKIENQTAENRLLSPRRQNSKINTIGFATKLLSKETAGPKIIGIRSTSIDADLNNCALSAVRAITNELMNTNNGSATSWKESETLLNSLYNSDASLVMVEVALAAATTGSAHVDSELYYETVYCGTSLRFVQSGLVPDAVYYLRCRAYCGDGAPMAWSRPEEFRTESGTLFAFDSMKCGPDILLNEDSLVASYAGDDTWSTLLGNKSFCSGVTSWEIRINQSSTAYVFIGVATSAADLHTFLGGCANGWGFIGEQALYHNREKVKIYGETFSSGDVIGVTLDLYAGTLSFSKNKKNLGVAFDKIYGELFPAVAFYNVGQEIEILSEGFKTSCPQENFPVSPCRLNMDELSLLNELVLCIYHKQPLSYRLTTMLVEHCNRWCTSSFTRCKAVSGKDVYVSKDSPLLKRFGLTVGERVRTIYGVGEVLGAAFSRIWFRIGGSSTASRTGPTSSEDGKVWFFTPQQILDGRAKKLFLRCTYDSEPAQSADNDSSLSAAMSAVALLTDRDQQSSTGALQFDVASIADLVDPTKWSDDMDHLLISYLMTLAESGSGKRSAASSGAVWKVTAEQVCENFRPLQQQLTRLAMDNHTLSHKWGISGPKRKAVLARLGLLRMFNQLLEMYLPFLITDSANCSFLPDSKAGDADDFMPLQVTLPSVNRNSGTAAKEAVDSAGQHSIVRRSVITTGPVISFSWDPVDSTISSRPSAAYNSQELYMGPLHAVRRRVFQHLKLAHFLEMLRNSATRPAKTEDDYDYPDDLAHVKVNRIKAFRAREAAELLHIPGEDLLLQSMFCQLWRELREFSSDKLRISYTHPMDDGQSRTFKVKFDGEGVDDYGGPYREIFQQVCEELQISDPGESVGGSKRPSSWEQPQPQSREGGDSSAPTRCFLPLLLPTANWTASGDCKERYKYTFHPASTSPLHLELFRFMGQFVGIAVRSRITLDLSLPSFLWKCVAGEPLCEEDLRSFDEAAHQFVSRLRFLHLHVGVGPNTVAMDGDSNSSISSSSSGGGVHFAGGDDEAAGGQDSQLLQAELDELLGDLTWTAKRTDGQVVDLVEHGSKLPVKRVDLLQYLTLYTRSRLTESSAAVEMFRCGLTSVLPECCLSLLSWQELQDFVCGQRVIDVQRLRENTEYDDDLSAEDVHIQFFWQVLAEDFSEAEKSAFLRFVWARPTLPPVGVEFSQKMRVLSAVGEDATLKPDQYLPKAHTCFFSINLPKYSSRQLMAEKLRYAIFNCTEMDADFRTTEAEVAGWGGAAGAAGGAGGSFAAQADWQADLDLN